VQQRDIMTAGILHDLRTPGGLYSDAGQDSGTVVDGTGSMGIDAQLLDAQVSLDQYGGIGNWLFSDWENGTFW